ncbi:FadR/GntR family transcriptional regulator [Chitinimonas koreensis]|uniref:FadR/GntR family transcriptional regulator n=1 Tax=Chitinimonas koreensis TaxID=356302 RepID=UPI000555E96D|nr:FCD domain-containing protein [Chitinimonas koreensis]QNM94789.1 FadR family transcriptional regulator [Chitinimonas koreensis]
MTDSKVFRRSLTDQVADLLRARIEAGDWPLMSRIPTEPELVELTGASRNTVREAVRVLVAAGMLEARQGDGTYVLSRVDPSRAMLALSRAPLREHLELRCLLEVEAARLAALRRDEADLAALRALLPARGDRAEGREEGMADFIEHDVRFHRRIADASGNAALAALYGFFSVSLAHHLGTTLRDTTLPEPGHAEHARIVDAIEAGDAAEAAEAARAVIAPMLEVLRGRLGDER